MQGESSCASVDPIFFKDSMHGYRTGMELMVIMHRLLMGKAENL